MRVAASQASAERVTLFAADELADGDRRCVQAFGTEVAVFRVNGEFYAINNTCPHHGAPLCRGSVGGVLLSRSPHQHVYGLDNEVLTCPWHGWQFELKSGATLFDPLLRARTYPVEIDQGMVVLVER
jgi:nitrite reductase (NADH) small subunit